MIPLMIALFRSMATLMACAQEIKSHRGVTTLMSVDMRRLFPNREQLAGSTVVVADHLAW
jgi:hypothetical protein